MTTPPQLPSGYEFSTDSGRIDAARVHQLLLEHAHWAQGRARETSHPWA